MKRVKGRKRKKLPRGKSLWVTSDFVQPLLLLLIPILTHAQNKKSQVFYFRNQKLRKKLQIKLNKIKAGRVFDSKLFYRILNKLRKLKFESKFYKKPFRSPRAYKFLYPDKGHLYIQRKVASFMSSSYSSFFKTKACRKKLRQQSLLNTSFKQKLINLCYIQKKAKQQHVTYRLKTLFSKNKKKEYFFKI